MGSGPGALEDPALTAIESERRRDIRLSTSGGPYRVSFRFRDRHIAQARLANVSAGGCGLEIQMADARDLDTGAVLEEFFLLHPDLPCVPLQATVVRMLGKVPGKTSGYVLAGVEFSLITPFVQQLIRDHVETHAGVS
jgi:c-di-GMP-binding flagellar brake protein YcgR